MAQSNPNWTREELILALDLFFRKGGDRMPGDTDPDVIELAALLRSLPIHPPEARAGNFRTAGSIAFKCGNFMRFLPEGGGPHHGGHLDEVVWNEFHGDRDRLRAEADELRRLAKDPDAVAQLSTVEIADDEEDAAAHEGEIKFKLHKQRERDRGLPRKKKASVLRKTGRLACEACGHDFANVYGKRGEGFIECHHVKPIAALQAGDETRLEDLALVCANCHRMLHYGGNITIEELKKMITTR